MYYAVELPGTQEIRREKVSQYLSIFFSSRKKLDTKI